MKTLIQMLLHHAERHSDGVGLRYLHKGDIQGRTTEWLWSDIASRSISLARGLRDRGLVRGDRAILLYADGPDLVPVFLGCLIAGVIPTVVAAQDLHPRRGGKLIAGIARVCNPRVVLTTMTLAPRATSVLANHAIQVPVDETDALVMEQNPWKGPLPDLDDVAFLQFTSGSTSSPRGVIVTHRNLAEHQQILVRAHDVHERAHLVTWLPTHHDMGLVGEFLLAVWTGRPLTMMTPEHFVERPMRWLEAISRQPHVRSGGPNFAFALVLRKLEREVLARLDLSSWETAYCGAEPVRRQVLQSFAETLSATGFHPAALCPSYGLAEATLYVGNVRPWRNGFSASNGEYEGFTASGTVPGHVEVAIVDDRGLRVPDGMEGEIWARSAAIASGYWDAPEATKATFGAQLQGDEGGPWLRTGDLGRVVDGMLYPTGRIKDLIIWRGENIYPQDVEITVEGAHPAIRPGCSAAFAVNSDDGSEAIGIVAEIGLDLVNKPEVWDEIVQHVRRAVASEFGVHVADVALIAPRELLKTTSGKVMRSANRNAMQNGSLRLLRHSRVERLVPSAAEVHDVLRTWLSAVSGAPSDTILDTTSLRELGIDSVRRVELRDHLCTQFQSTFTLKQLGDDPTVGAISSLLRGIPSNAVASPAKPQIQTEQTPATTKPVVLPDLKWRRAR